MAPHPVEPDIMGLRPQSLLTYLKEVHPSQPLTVAGVSELCFAASASALFVSPTCPSGPSLCPSDVG